LHPERHQTTRGRIRSLMKYKTHFFYPDTIFLGNIFTSEEDVILSSIRDSEKKRNGVNPWSFHTWLKSPRRSFS
jgi:hypothetical protein